MIYYTLSLIVVIHYIKQHVAEYYKYKCVCQWGGEVSFPFGLLCLQFEFDRR